MTIEADNTAQMVEIVAGLVEKGLTFTAVAVNGDEWVITLTGGY
jgi:hypothetical protein